MPIKSKQANRIYHGCLLCQAIDELEAFLAAKKEYEKLINESALKRILLFKNKWLDALNQLNEK